MGCDRHADVVEAGNLSACRAEKVRMLPLGIAGMAVPLDFEPPDMVTEFDAAHELFVGEFDEVPVDRGPVEAAVVQGLGDLRVRPWSSRRVEVLQDGHSRGRAPQPSRSDAGLDDVEISIRCATHPGYPTPRRRWPGGRQRPR